jgi:predicted esterase
MRELLVQTATHGRVLVDEGAADPLRLLVGFHGYAQSADEMLTWLRTIPGAETWTAVSVQGLHRFYRSRSEVTVASWMTRQDREVVIADNIAYVDAALTAAAGGREIARLVYCGFSQGVAMAFRAGVRGAHRADAVLALGGDVPPELLADDRASFPRVLLARGAADAFYTADKLRADQSRLDARRVRVETLTFDGGHAWHPDFAARGGQILEVPDEGS